MKHSPEDKPRLRWPLETEQVEHEGKPYLILRDAQGIAAEPAVIPAGFVPIVSRFDGEHRIADIAHEGAPFGITADLVVELAGELSRMLFLDDPDSARKAAEIRDSFRDLPVREAAHAGLVYPADPADLRKTLTDYIERADRRLTDQVENVAALIAPHIDYRRGWQAYGAAYSALELVERPEVVFLIGTSHQPAGTMFQLTVKDFDTPLGRLPAARRIIDDIAARGGGERLFRDELLHKREHSLELQLPFLAHRYAGDLPPIVPMLVGSFHRHLIKGTSPLRDPEVADFVGALAEAIRTLETSGERVLFYGGVDLAHMGLHFGDPDRVSDRKLPDIAARDQELLSCVLQSDEEALFNHIAEDCDKRRICGFPSMYTMLAAMRQANIRLRGHFIDYRQSVDPKTDCIVTFASACWSRA